MGTHDLIQGHLLPFFPRLVGRAMEVKAASALLSHEDRRILTLTGAGGIGKTSLALQVATKLRPSFPDGVYFVPLASVSDPAQMIPTIARALEMHESADNSLQEQVQDYLRDRSLLLLLDNFEQVVEAAPLLNDLLAASSTLRILVTSRVRLQLDGEQVFSLSPLALPDLTHLPDKQELARVASVDLFLQRSRLVQPNFELTKANARTVAAICARLDGLPLAVELAAARIKLLPPQALLKRLENSLSILTSNADERPSRHQTLRNTIQWSYDLLTPEEQQLFRVLTIFVDGFTKHAAEALYSQLYGSSENVPDHLSSLLDKHLLRASEQDKEDPRFQVLEMVRAFGLEMLEANDEREKATHAHMRYFLALAEDGSSPVPGPQEVERNRRLERELANLRIAMQYSLTYGKQAGTMDIALRLGTALKNFWIARSYLREGKIFLEQSLAECRGEINATQAQAAFTLASFALLACDYPQAQQMLEQCRIYHQEQGDKARLADLTWQLGWLAQLQYSYAQARLLYKEALKLGEETQNEYLLDNVRYNLAYLARAEGDYQQSRVLMEGCLAYRRKNGSPASIAAALGDMAQLLKISSIIPPVEEMQRLLDEGMIYAREAENSYLQIALRNGLAWVAFLRKNFDEAMQMINEVITSYKKAGKQQSIGHYIELLARIYAAQGKYAEASIAFEESVIQSQKQDDIDTASSDLIELAYLAAEQSQFARAIRLLGADENLREQASIPVTLFDSTHRDHTLTIARAVLGREIFELLWQEGRALPPIEALAAGNALPANRKTSSKHITYPAGLSRREIDVLRLVAQGFTDSQIAEQLVISPRTVTTHLTSIYNKLQVGSRAAATNFAVRNHLI